LAYQCDIDKKRSVIDNLCDMDKVRSVVDNLWLPRW